MTEHTVTLKAVLDQTELGDLNSVQSGVQTNFDKNISSVITKLNVTLANLQRSVDKLTQTTQRSSNIATRAQNAAIPVSKSTATMPVVAPNIATNASFQRRLEEVHKQIGGLRNYQLMDRVHKEFVKRMVAEGSLTKEEAFVLLKSKYAHKTGVDMIRSHLADNLHKQAASLRNKIKNTSPQDQQQLKALANERKFIKGMGLMFGANIFGGLAQTVLPQNHGLRRGIDVAQNTLGGAMSGMMIGGPMGALAFGGATLGSSLLVDYMTKQQNLRLREQTANNSIREAKKNFEETMKSLDEFYKTLASARLDAQIQKDSAEWFKQATKSINETGALNPLLVSQRSSVQSNLAKQISNVEANLYKVRNERYNRQLTYNKDIAYLDESKALYSNVQDPTQRAELLARVEKQRTQLTQDYAKAMVNTNTQIDDFTDKLADLKEQLKQLSEYEKNLKDAQQKSIRTFVEGQQSTLLRESAEKIDKETNLEAYRSGFHSMYRLASEYEQSRNAYDRELDEYLASDHTAETPQEVTEKTNRLLYDRQRAQQNLQEMMALNVRKRQELNQELMGDYSNLTRMITSSQNAFSSRGFGFEEGNARNAAVIDIRNIARQIKENTDLLKQAGVYQ